MSTPEGLYRELARILSDRQNNVLEIEILPPEFGPLLHDGHAIGVTKKALVQAFLVARQIFFDSLAGKSGQNSDAPSTVSPPAVDQTAQTGKPSNNVAANEIEEKVSLATEIMLLFDCEHLTACNWRKRRIATLMQHMQTSDTTDDSSFSASTVVPGTMHRREEKLAQLLETERSLMTTYLCSPLHRHTKSPTLWQHRLWVMSQLIKIQQQQTDKQRLSLKSRLDLASTCTYMRRTLETELNVALRAGELHPKNYYAFSYMRQLHSVLSRAMEGDISQNRAGEGESVNHSSELAGYLVDPVLTWCLAHPRDISGWIFLLYLLEASAVKQVQKNVVRKVVQFALNVGWESESLWTFVDLATRKFDVEIMQLDSWRETSDTVDRSRGGRVVNGVALSEKRWKTWVAWAKAIRATDALEDSVAFLSAERE
ncbi:hypothetical protein VTN00DRAFT_1470 [Thermoascus crustaceus]|uniref:uncharacterized protein n=1 Tax=Thermoascus crustaceus TaxID=5088 RepID=UPI003744212A